MTLVKPFTAKRIADIQANEDEIDREYVSRMFRLETHEQLRDLIMDYEEFLPEGLQRFRDCDEKSFNELISQIRRFRDRIINHQPLPAEPTEAIMFISPPMLTIPRGFARNMSQEMGKHITWGRGFKRLAQEGMIAKLQKTQDYMYRRIIEIKDYVEEHIDVKSALTESDMKTVIPMTGNAPGSESEQ